MSYNATHSKLTAARDAAAKRASMAFKLDAGVNGLFLSAHIADYRKATKELVRLERDGIAFLTNWEMSMIISRRVI